MHMYMLYIYMLYTHTACVEALSTNTYLIYMYVLYTHTAANRPSL